MGDRTLHLGSRKVDRWTGVHAEHPPSVETDYHPPALPWTQLPCAPAFQATLTTTSDAKGAEHSAVSPGFPTLSRAYVHPAPPPGLTDHTEGLPGELEPPSPAAVPAAAARGPDPHKILHAKHHDGHNFLQGKPQLSHCRDYSSGWGGLAEVVSLGSSPKPGAAPGEGWGGRAPQRCILDWGDPSVTHSSTDLQWLP